MHRLQHVGSKIELQHQTPSNLPQVGHTKGAKTFPLRNQYLALEYLKDQLGFLVTIILGGDSPFHKTKTPTSIPTLGRVASMSSSREGTTSAMNFLRFPNLCSFFLAIYVLRTFELLRKKELISILNHLRFLSQLLFNSQVVNLFQIKHRL